MKKFLSCAFLFLLLMTASPAVFAAGTEYEVADFDFTLMMPDGWTTLTRDIKSGDPGLTELGLEKDALLQQYEDYNIYLNSIRLMPLSEIVVTVIKHKDYEDIHNMSLLSLKQINELGEFMTGRSSGTAEGAEYYGYSTYAKDGITFLVLDFSQTTDGRTAYSKQYSTVVNGDLISIMLRDYDGEIPPDDERLLKETADSLSFGHIDTKKIGTGFFNKFSSFKSVGYSMLIAGAVIFIIVILINNGGTKIKKITK